MPLEIVDNIVDQVFKERSLLKKLCFKGGRCTNCGNCTVPGAVKSAAIAKPMQAVKNITIGNMEVKDIAGMIDHTLLKPCADKEQVLKLCEEAKSYSFASVCVNLCWVELCSQILRGSKVKVCSVIGFPLGATSTEIKAAEAKQAIADGAAEIDMVINVGQLKSGNKDYVYNDIRQVVSVCKKNNALLKVIIETCLLTDEEKIMACLMTRQAGADFVKTSTGFNCGGATVGDVALMRKVVGPNFGVKASGGIKTLEDALAMISNGANRLGTSSGIKIVSK